MWNWTFFLGLTLFSFFGVDRELNAGAAVSVFFTPLRCIYLSAQNDLFKKPFSVLDWAAAPETSFPSCVRSGIQSSRGGNPG